jgi:hypothetical protein
VDVKAAAYEGLLEKAASEGKKGAGQLFTPRVLIKSIVRCIKPDPRGRKDFTICDPACGTGGFLVAAYEWLIDQTKGGALERSEARYAKDVKVIQLDISAEEIGHNKATEVALVGDGKAIIGQLNQALASRRCDRLHFLAEEPPPRRMARSPGPASYDCAGQSHCG